MGRRIRRFRYMKNAALLLLMTSCLAFGATPAVFRVKIETTAGNFVVEVHRDWAPRGADRFYELVQDKFFDDSRFYRTVAGHWVQFGIPGNPKLAQQWRHRSFADDPAPHQHNDRAYVAFAMTGPDQRTTQVYMNLVDNRQWMWSTNCIRDMAKRQAEGCAQGNRINCSRKATRIWIANFRSSITCFAPASSSSEYAEAFVRPRFNTAI
jgi:cyclophilin family peptidyl-prolyl cis-trans isomerase